MNTTGVARSRCSPRSPAASGVMRSRRPPRWVMLQQPIRLTLAISFPCSRRTMCARCVASRDRDVHHLSSVSTRARTPRNLPGRQSAAAVADTSRGVSLRVTPFVPRRKRCFDRLGGRLQPSGRRGRDAAIILADSRNGTRPLHLRGAHARPTHGSDGDARAAAVESDRGGRARRRGRTRRLRDRRAPPARLRRLGTRDRARGRRRTDESHPADERRDAC